MRRGILTFAAAAMMALVAAGTVEAKTLRWANDGDANSMDPYARNETFLLSMVSNIYEPLIRRDKTLKLQAALATQWSQTAPEVWRFKLRQGVKFHDGTPFTADDVVFSYERASGPGSNMAGLFTTVKDVKKVDAETIDITTKGPNPILPEELSGWFIMSKVWAEKNNATKSADLTKNEESFATRNANGTGPFMLKEREPDVKTVLVPNPNWWDKPEHNLTEVIFSRIANASTRVAALLSGEIDMIYNVPPQDQERIAKTKGLQLIQGPELRVIYLSMDVSRDELLESSVKGKNPMKDIRVRKAFYQAIDIEAIKTKIMRGQSIPTALMIAGEVNGFDKSLNTRFPYDVNEAKKLLTEAGYPNGFEIGMDCPTDRYVNDEGICQAVVAMLARIGVKVNLNAQTKAKFFAKVNALKFETSFYLIGWTPSTYDAHNMLLNIVGTRGPNSTAGMFNLGAYSNKRVDDLTAAIQVETDQAKRQGMISEALKIVRDDVATIPLHQQTIVWAAKTNIDLVQQADNYFPLRFVNVK